MPETSPDTASPFMPIREVAGRIGRSRSRTYGLVASGELPATRVGGRLVVPRAAFERWMAKKVDDALAGVHFEVLCTRCSEATGKTVEVDQNVR